MDIILQGEYVSLCRFRGEFVFMPDEAIAEDLDYLTKHPYGLIEDLLCNGLDLFDSEDFELFDGTVYHWEGEVFYNNRHAIDGDLGVLLKGRPLYLTTHND